MADILKKKIPSGGGSSFKCFEARAFLMCSRKGKEPNVAEAKKRGGKDRRTERRGCQGPDCGALDAPL